MPQPDAPYHEQAADLVQQGKVSEALDCYDRALRASPDNDVILNNKAMAFISLGRFGEAYATAKHAAAVNPASADVWINMGVALEKLDRLPEAAEALERAVSIDPYHAYARAMLGMMYQKMDMGDRAEAQNRKLQEIVFPKVYAGLYFATAALLLGILLGGILSVDGKPPEITIPSEIIIVLFFLVICGLYWRSLRMWQEINRNVIVIHCRQAPRPDRGSNSQYIILAVLAIVFIAGILLGNNVWNWMH